MTSMHKLSWAYGVPCDECQKQTPSCKTGRCSGIWVARACKWWAYKKTLNCPDCAANSDYDITSFYDWSTVSSQLCTQCKKDYKPLWAPLAPPGLATEPKAKEVTTGAPGDSLPKYDPLPPLKLMPVGPRIMLADATKPDAKQPDANQLDAKHLDAKQPDGKQPDDKQPDDGLNLASW